MIKLEVYGCSHCAMVSRRKGSVVRHELSYCKKNQNRKRCGNCNHMSFEQGGSSECATDYNCYVAPEWYCTKKEEDLDGMTMNDFIDCEHWILRR